LYDVCYLIYTNYNKVLLDKSDSIYYNTKWNSVYLKHRFVRDYMNNFLKNITRILTFIISLLLAYLIFVIGITNINSNNRKKHGEESLETSTPADATLLDAQNEVATSMDAETEAECRRMVEDIIDSSNAITVWEDRPKTELPTSVAIEMELIYQHPELPTGCESVALTMLLKYYGFELEKTTIASDYLIYGTNFVEGYVGNPFTSGGAGIYSPGLTRTANKYLNAQGSELNAKNVTGSTPEELYRYVSEGTPVVIWNTVYFLQNQPTGSSVKWGEKTYTWDNCEHCMVLSGYDLERNVVIVHDPIQGIMERDADGFWERYEKLGSMAIIIK